MQHLHLAAVTCRPSTGRPHAAHPCRPSTGPSSTSTRTLRRPTCRPCSTYTGPYLSAPLLACCEAPTPPARANHRHRPARLRPRFFSSEKRRRVQLCPPRQRVPAWPDTVQQHRRGRPRPNDQVSSTGTRPSQQHRRASKPPNDRRGDPSQATPPPTLGRDVPHDAGKLPDERRPVCHIFVQFCWLACSRAEHMRLRSRTSPPPIRAISWPRSPRLADHRAPSK